jgi:hypothetical protein
MREIKPPHPIHNEPNGNISIFLAGSIEMGAAKEWQAEFVDAFKGHPVTFYNPRRESWDSSWDQSILAPQFYQQVNWEMNALESADVIVMYFDPNTKSPISLLELGLYADSKKIFVCCPAGFWRKGNVDIVCDRYGIPSFDNLQNMAEHIKRNVFTTPRAPKFV